MVPINTQGVAVCMPSGASVAAIAAVVMATGVNANLLRR